MKILIGTDLSQESLAALRQGFEMAARVRDVDQPGQVYVAYVEGQGTWYPQVGTGTILDDPDNRRRMEGQVREFITEYLGEDLDYDLLLEEGRAEKKLDELAERISADWLLVGMSGQGALAKLVTGSTAEKLAHRPPCNLAIAHPNGIDWEGPAELMVGIDFSDSSHKALEMALDLAERTHAHLHIVHVVYPPGPIVLPDGLVGYAGGEYQEVTQVRERAKGEMSAVIDEREGRLGEISWTSEVLTGYPTRELVGYAEDNEIDAILLGTVGRSALDDFLLGSVASGVVKHMPCSVFMTPPAK
ncbi:MAG: universal stress protein [Persicimonas sp.]